MVAIQEAWLTFMDTQHLAWASYSHDDRALQDQGLRLGQKVHKQEW